MRQNKTQFPAGPYTCSRDKDGCDDVWNIFAAGRERPITTIPFGSDDAAWAVRAEATARLFTAAPDMLQALCEADGCLALLAGRGYTDFPAGKRIRAAIRAAGGTREKIANLDNVRPPVRTRTLSQALANVLGHFLPVERADFEQMDDEAVRENHIFTDLRVLNDWLRRLAGVSYI